MILNMVGNITDISKAEDEVVNPRPNVSTPAAQPSYFRFYDKPLIFPPLSDARKFEPWKKYLFTGIVSLAAVAAPLQSTMLMRMSFLIRSI